MPKVLDRKQRGVGTERTHLLVYADDVNVLGEILKIIKKNTDIYHTPVRKLVQR
jgi:hypothetical protein